MVNKKTTPKAPFSKIAFTSILCLTLITFLGLGWQTWRSHKNVKTFQAQDFRIQELIGTIMHLDEVLTMSARMGTKTGDFKWEERYLKFEPQLGAAINEAKRLVPEAFILKAAIQTDTANTKRVAMEKRAFELVRQGQKEEASAILFSEEYQGQKQIYAQGMKQVKASMRDHITNILNEYRRHEFFTIVTILTVLPVLFFTFIYILLLTRRRYDVERTLSEDKLKKYGILFDNISDLAYICDTEGNVLFLNKVFEKFSGHKPEEFIGKSFAPLFEGEDLKKAMDLYSRTLNGENPQQEVCFKDTGILCEYKSIPLRDERRNITGVIGIARDVTERKKMEDILLESEEKFRKITSSAHDAVVMMDENGKVLFWNEAAQNIFGYLQEEIIGKNLHKLIVPERYYEDYLKGMEDFKINGTGNIINKTLTLPGLRKDGTEFFADHSFSSVKLKGKWQAISIIRDITERKRLEVEIKESNKTLEKRVTERTKEIAKTNNELLTTILQHKKAEELLQKNREQLQSILDNTTAVIYIKDKDGRYILINRQFETLFHISCENIIGKTDMDIFPEEMAEAFRTNDNKILNTGRPLELEEIAPHDDGPHTYISIKFPIFNLNGIPDRICGISTDITERKQAEEILRESEAKYGRLTENLRDNHIFYSHNTNGIFTYISPSITNILGYTPEEFLTHYSEYMTDSPGNQEVIKHTELSISGIKQPPYEVELYHKDGSIRTLKVQEVPVFDNNQNVIAVEGIAEDITKHKHAEEKFVNYQTQLKSLSSALSLTEERERRHISEELHDRIGQALTVIKMKLEKLQEPQTETDTDLVLSETWRLLDQAIQDTRTLTFELSPPVLFELGFEPAVEWLVDQFKKQHNIAIDFVDCGLTGMVEEDVIFFLFKSVRELLFNAIKHARAHRIKVTLLKEDNKIRIDIDDDGIGFDFSNAQFSVDKLSGFGLFSIRERMEHFGGNFDIKSEPGQGACVTLTMPLKQQEGDAGAK